MRAVILILALVSAALPAAAAPLPPMNGLYTSVSQGGTLLDGRFSESWVGGQEGAIGNTLNVASWDGSGLGSEWRVWCASMAAAPVLVSDTRGISGTGEVTYRSRYAGGRFWLAKDGPWSVDNLADFTGDLQSVEVTSTHQFVSGQRIGVRSNVTLSGVFDLLAPNWAPACMDYLIANTSVLGTTASAAVPGGYPGLLDPASCPGGSGDLPDGAWGSVTQITLLVTGCAVPTKTATWGSLKSRYTD